MARKLRVEYPGALYHVMNRGDRREEEDKRTMICQYQELTRLRHRRGLVVSRVGCGILSLAFIILSLAVYRIIVKPLNDERQAYDLLQKLATSVNNDVIINQMRQLLDGGDLKPVTGNQILAAMMSQHVMVRSNYLAGHKVLTKLYIDSQYRFLNYELFASAKAMTGDECLGKVGDFAIKSAELPDYEFYKGIVQGKNVVSTAVPGDYEARIELNYKLYAKPPRVLIWPSYRRFPKNLLPVLGRRVNISNVATFECKVVVPVHLHVVRDPGMKLLSSHELDSQVASSIVMDMVGANYAIVYPRAVGPSLFFERADSTIRPSARTDPNNLEIRSATRLRISDSPVNLSLAAKFKDKNGALHALPAMNVLLRNGQSSEVLLRGPYNDSQGMPIGQYEGELILETDQGLAYEDVTIDDIWNGSLKFPIEFDIVDVKRQR